MSEQKSHPSPISTFASGGFLRLDRIIAPHGPLPISKSSWWSKVRSGEFPQPVKLGPRTTAWRAQDIIALIQHFEAAATQKNAV
ncbi:AlpA family phage regulatory protein [Rhizobium sp. Leaf306]|uniref:helix-turn-helix transcriptional regulator n=1 Tax=Rhizobium sp. Leaf306 TaxID=1736330 RepID=UPI0009E6B126|nr:AlpA family phage regulatory protein [Rhizobium sp. Leaf306]